MKTTFASLRQKRLRMLSFIALSVLAVGSLGAQTLRPRILSEVNDSESTPIKGSLHPLAQAQNEAGRMAANTPLQGITLQFSRSAAQEADLQALLAAQQDPASPQYHQWLTPEQFAARFGMADADVQKVQSWLEQQGFAVDSVNRSHNAIRFSGTVGQVERAFQTQMHYYQANGEKHFAPSTVLSIPSALSGVVKSVRNLTDLRPRPQHIVARSQFTSSVSGGVFFAPGDIATAYDIKPLYAGGVNGAGQTIAIMGQSAVQVSDIENFQNAAGLTKKDPTMVLVPNTGSSTRYSGDESESDLDLEWSGAIAPGANIVFVYTGSSNNQGIYDSIQYAVDELIAPILSVSYSSCETEITPSTLASLESIFQQAAAQGQTVLAASGDQGSTACSGDTNLSTAQQQVIAVNYPASSAYVLGIGGTEITSANSTSSNSTYWQAASGSDVLTSVKQYIPEVAWNDNGSSGLSASGGGSSTLVARPTWQAGVPGIPSGNNRLVPDVSLYSSPSNPGYLYCSSDTSVWTAANGTTPAQQASCNSGFRDAATQDLTLAGGTSFATPIFAGMIAVLNQKQNYPTGQGLINPTFYKLAANSTTYASAFHDVTSGNNNCTAGTKYCGSTTGGFAAGTGYDEVTGLGSVDLNNLATAWPANSGASATLIGTTTKVSASNSAPTVGASVTYTITVTGDSGSGTPTGTVKLSIDGGDTTNFNSSGSTATVTLSNGVATYSTSFSSSGMHVVVAKYQGDGTYAASTGSSSVSIAIVSSGKGTIALAAAPATLNVTQGQTGTETVTATPSGGYTGTVLLSIDFGTSGDKALQNLCGGFTNANSSGDGVIQIPGTASATTQLVLDTKASDCSTTAAVIKTGMHPMKHLMKTSPTKSSPASKLPGSIAMGGLVLIGLLGRRSRKLRNLAAVITLVAAGFAMSACSSSVTNSNTTVTNPPKGTYTATITGTDSVTSSITTSTTFSFVIQ